MQNFDEIKRNLGKVEQLERELSEKQLQINRLLNITQAINNNVSARDLYRMYNSFLNWEMGVRKMALFVPSGEQWKCATHLGIADEIAALDLSDTLPAFKRMRNIKNREHPFFKEFEVVIPVLHKKYPIAYTFLGGFDDQDDVYNKVQFITTITNIIAVAIENKRLFKRQIEQERLNREMELAKDMQEMLVPRELPVNKCYELASIYKPHFSVGGDYFDFVELGKNRFVFCLADITGKGLAAALLMSNFQANFRTLIQKEDSFESLIHELNDSVFRITKGEKFLTFFVARYDQNTNLLTYINAGHIPPVLVTKDQTILLKKGCTILGPFQELPFLEVGSHLIREETLIVSFTDGLTDIRNEQGDFIEEKLLQQFATENASLSVRSFNNKLLEVVNHFKGGASYPDDITILTCKIFKPV